MSTAVAKAPKKAVATKGTSLGTQTVKDFVKNLKGGDEEEDVAKILGLSEDRTNELNDWVDCEGTNRQAIQNFTGSLKNIEEIAYCFYYFGVLNTKDRLEQ